MAALTEDRNTPRRGDSLLVGDAIAASTILFAGGMYVLDSTGAAKPAVAADKKPVRAVATRQSTPVDEIVPGERAVFRFNNSAAAAAISRADIGNNAFAADDNTVAKTGSCIAGEIIDVDDVGVWVHVGKAAVPTTA
ncbi:hypothetical protein [Comamonas sp.]|uniref:hypothetical protein n=1 Tax=Comamonas sp. TaxID=34028 RepID=UPI00258E7F82|nr:hypothetical protein [Comamonas sp.]